MSTVRYRPRWALLTAAAVVFGIVSSAQACPVCFGDPESNLTQGAQAGVLFMVGVIYTVLMGFVSVTAFWFVRARRARLRQGNGENLPESAGGRVDSPTPGA